MSISADLIRGHTDSIILALLRKGDSYGYEINKAIAGASHGCYELKEATLYTAFKRLEEAGWIRSYWGEGTIGARRKYYTITPMGIAAHERQLADWRETRELLDRLLTAEGGNDHA